MKDLNANVNNKNAYDNQMRDCSIFTLLDTSGVSVGQNAYMAPTERSDKNYVCDCSEDLCSVTTGCEVMLL